VQNQIAPIAGGGDVQKRELVGALVVVTRRNFYRVPGIAQLDKMEGL
jgi:hypothetical protein